MEERGDTEGTKSVGRPWEGDVGRAVWDSCKGLKGRAGGDIRMWARGGAGVLSVLLGATVIAMESSGTRLRFATGDAHLGGPRGALRFVWGVSG